MDDDFHEGLTAEDLDAMAPFAEEWKRDRDIAKGHAISIDEHDRSDLVRSRLVLDTKLAKLKKLAGLKNVAH